MVVQGVGVAVSVGLLDCWEKGVFLVGMFLLFEQHSVQEPLLFVVSGCSVSHLKKLNNVATCWGTRDVFLRSQCALAFYGHRSSDSVGVFRGGVESVIACFGTLFFFKVVKPSRSD